MNQTLPSRALLVDDDPGVLAFMSRAVEGMGVRTERARSRSEACARLSAEAFDVVISDVIMESSDAGLRLAEDAERLRPGIPVILISGQEDMGALLPGLGAGACDYLSKPFLLGELSSAVTRALRLGAAAASEPKGEDDRELCAAYGELAKVERMREAMLSIVSHELRTPLCAARLAAAEIAPSGAESDGPQAILDRSLDRLQTVIEDMLLHAQLSAGIPPAAPRRVDFAALVRAQAGVAAKAADAAGRTLELEIAGDPRPVLADAEAVSRAVGHLLSNAIRFNRPGGAVRVRLEFGKEEAELAVADQGEGIPEAEHGKIFDPYYQVADYLTRRVGGLGLGLAIVRRVFEGHGGSVRVSAGARGGSLFRAALPLAV